MCPMCLAATWWTVCWSAGGGLATFVAATNLRGKHQAVPALRDPAAVAANPEIGRKHSALEGRRENR